MEISIIKKFNDYPEREQDTSVFEAEDIIFSQKIIVIQSVLNRNIERSGSDTSQHIRQKVFRK